MMLLSDQNKLVEKLKNILKLPKAQRWTSCEWFYSDIDRAIFESENDFSICLNQSFPKLKTRKLTRKQWCFVRNLIGKPRRCSNAFFREERQSLEEKREKIRLIQQRKINEKDLIDFKDIPQEIPLPLSIGHRVYAHIFSPENGVFIGSIAAIDTVEHTYRVVFDRASIGSQTVPDYNIKSLTSCQLVPIKAYVQTYRPKTTQITPHKFLQTPTNTMYLLDELSNTGLTTPQTSNLIIQSHLSNNLLNDPMLAVSSPLKFNEDPLHHYLNANNNNNMTTASDPNSNGLLGGFPIRLLVSITRLNKILNVKKEYIKKLNDLNTEAEYLKVNKNFYSKEFQLKYASLIIDIEKLNKDLSDYLAGVQRYCEEYAPDFKLFFKNLGSNNSENIHKKSLIEAREMVNRLNKATSSSTIVKTERVVDLIKKLTSIMLQIRDYANATPIGSQNETLIDSNDNNNFDTTSATITSSINNDTSQNQQQNQFDTNTYVDTKSINITIDDIKSKLSATNKKIFEDKVQVHVNHIQTALNYYSKLHAFKETDDSLIEFINNRSETMDIIKSMINDSNSSSSSSSSY